MAAVTAAVIAAAAIGAGTSIYTAKEQEKAADEQQAELKAAEEAKKKEADRIAKETAPDQETFTGIQYGADTEGDELGNVSDFLVPKTSALGTTGSGSSLGFKI